MASSQCTSISSNSFRRWASHDIFLFKYHCLLHILRFPFFFSDNIMADVISKQQTTALFLSTIVTRTRRHTELIKKTDKPYGKPVLCQKTFISVFIFLTQLNCTVWFIVYRALYSVLFPASLLFKIPAVSAIPPSLWMCKSMTVHNTFSHYSAHALWCKRVLIIPRVHCIPVKFTQRLVQQLENRLLTPKLDDITACQSQVSTCHG